MHGILGIIAEYNPFHNGHYYQLQTAARETGCAYIVIAMSGNFVQRGEPAVFDKWRRAEMALSAGADLVLEIPTWHVLQSAEGFAQAGVALLASCGVTHLSFGSESGTASDLQDLARWLDCPGTQEEIRSKLNSGITYAAAVQRAAESASPDVVRLAPLLNGANNILAIEYLRAVGNHAPDLAVHTVKRIGSAHGSMEIGGYAGATALRKLLLAGKTSVARELIPDCTVPVFDKAMADGPVFPGSLTQAVFYALLTQSSDALSGLPACSEGLENRLRKALFHQRDLDGLLQTVKTKRYPFTRIQRLIIQAVLQFNIVKTAPALVPYLRVLGCSTRGKELLAIAASVKKAPVIFSARDCKSLPEPARALLDLDCRAADIYSLAQRPQALYGDLIKTPVQL